MHVNELEDNLSSKEGLLYSEFKNIVTSHTYDEFMCSHDLLKTVCLYIILAYIAPVPQLVS